MLVIGVEKLSDVIDNSERSISFLLGDGAGAVVIGPSDTPGIGPSVWGSDGSKWDAIGMTRSMLDVRDLSMAARQSDESGDFALLEEAQELYPTLRQDGQTVFRWAVWEMAKMAEQALEAAGVKAEDLVAFIPHQANMRIIDATAKYAKIPPEKVFVNVDRYGNMSSASIPVALDEAVEQGRVQAGSLVLMVAFGAGFTWAANVVRM